VPNQLIKQGAKLVTSADDVIEELPTPVRAVLVHAEALGSEQRNLLAADGLSATEQKVYGMLSAEQPRHIDELVENTGLNSSEVLATLFTLEMKGIVQQFAAEAVRQGFVVKGKDVPLGPPGASEGSQSVPYQRTTARRIPI
jgi:predicted Rossmann fold nucleotide-binding protein DprA/Smf involved in DNA uptake